MNRQQSTTHDSAYASARIHALREQIHRMNSAGVYRTDMYRLAATSLRATEGMPVQLRRANAIAHILSNVNIVIHEHEPFAGSMLGMWTLCEDLPPYEAQRAHAIGALDALAASKPAPGDTDLSRAHVMNMEDEMAQKKTRWALMSRVHHDASLVYADYQTLLSEMEVRYAEMGLTKPEVAKVLERELRIPYDADDRALVSTLPWIPGNHIGLAYWLVLEKGFGGMLTEIKQGAAQSADDASKREYYEAAEICCQAMIDYIRRTAHAVRMHAQTSGLQSDRRQELQEMAHILDTIATSPASTYREALQTVWSLHIMANLVGGSALSFSRFDQYMRPYYEADIARGVPRDALKALTCCFFLQVNDPKIRTVQSLTVGGITPEGTDGCSDLTRLCLEVTREMKLPYPNMGVRVHEKNPDWLHDEIIRTVQAGCGQPMVLNDHVFIDNLKRLGYPDNAANDYYNMGCVEIMIPGKQPNWGVTDFVSFPMFFEPLFARYASGEPIPETFDAFMDAYLALLESAVQLRHKEAQSKQRSMENSCFDPLCSLLTEDCIARGSDMHQGGSRYPAHWSIYAHGLATLVDSLSAIRTCVYEAKHVDLQTLMQALHRDFAEDAQLLRTLETKTPTYGNDLDAPDEIAARVFSCFTDAIFRLNEGIDQPKYVSTFFSYFSHVLSGEVLMATANGRRRAMSLSDSMAPSQGKDTGGPTKMLNSVLKLDHTKVTGGYALNLKINPSIARSEKGAMALSSLLRAYLLSGGPQLQINFVDIDTMRDAQIHPDQHRDLIVRVGGYCEYFTNLDRTLQDEIIGRTIHEAM